VVATGESPVAAVIAGLLINVLHLPFGLAMAPVVGDRWPARLLGAHILVDESVAFSRARGTGRRARIAGWTSGLTFFVFWNVGALVGVFAGAAVPDTDAFGIDAAFPAALLALLLSGLAAPDAWRVGITAAVIAVAATPFLPADSGSDQHRCRSTATSRGLYSRSSVTAMSSGGRIARTTVGSSNAPSRDAGGSVQAEEV
jgi:predicted branched-subunit amino acid permease